MCVCVRVCMYVLYCNIASENGGDAEGVDIEVEFLIRGDLLRSTIESHLAKKTVSSVSRALSVVFLAHTTHTPCTHSTQSCLCVYRVCVSVHTLYTYVM